MVNYMSHRVVNYMGSKDPSDGVVNYVNQLCESLSSKLYESLGGNDLSDGVVNYVSH